MALLEHAAGVARRIDALPAEQPKQVFTLSVEDGKAITGCSAGDERAVAEWVLTGLHRVLAPGADLSGDTVKLLEAARSMLLSQEPKSALEGLLVVQAIATHQLAMSFASGALQARDPDTSGKLSERVARLCDVFCRQTETIQKIRGEAGRQHVTVTHLNVEAGAQALVGQLNHPGGSAKK
jgi:hypothetical protein